MKPVIEPPIRLGPPPCSCPGAPWDSITPPPPTCQRHGSASAQPTLGGPVLRRHSVVVTYREILGRQKIFRADAADGSGDFIELSLDPDGFLAMGSPESITLTLEPGGAS